MNRRDLMIGAGVLGLAGLARPALARIGAAAGDDAKSIARDAWIYGLPIIEMAATRAKHFKAGARVNRFNGGRALATWESRNVTTPNNDTLYLSAWIDISQGPATLTVPELGTRYWSVAVMDMFTNNNAVLGSRTVGGAGGTFTLLGPGQATGGPNPVRIATPHAWVLARVLVDGPEDVAKVQGLLKGFSLAGTAGPAPGAYVDRTAAPEAFFASVRELLASDPAPATDLHMLRRAAGLLTTGAPLDAAAVAAGVKDARDAIQGAWGREAAVQGWTYPRASLGDFGQDYGYRAAIALGGLAALPRAEAMYLRPVGEEKGLFTSDKTWKMSLPADVPVDGFWSLTMYEATPDGQFFFTRNPLDRYAIGDRSKQITRRADGGLDLFIGRTDPGGDKTANWLPAPKAGPYMVSWRAYLPRPALMDGAWRMPALVEA
jgi:hypothetical protein